MEETKFLMELAIDKNNLDVLVHLIIDNADLNYNGDDLRIANAETVLQFIKYIYPKTYKENSFPMLWHTHVLRIKQEMLTGIPRILKLHVNTLYVFLGSTLEQAFHVFSDNHLWAQLAHYIYEIEEKSIKHLLCLSLSETLFLSPCFLSGSCHCNCER